MSEAKGKGAKAKLKLQSKSSIEEGEIGAQSGLQLQAKKLAAVDDRSWLEKPRKLRTSFKNGRFEMFLHHQLEMQGISRRTYENVRERISRQEEEEADITQAKMASEYPNVFFRLGIKRRASIQVKQKTLLFEDERLREVFIVLLN